MENTKIPLNIILSYTLIYDFSYSNSKWNFEIKEINEEEGKDISSNSKFTVDINSNYKTDLAIRNIKEKTGNTIILFCHTQNTVSESSIIKLSNKKSEYSSVTWKEKSLPDNIEEMLITGNLHVDSIDNLKYDTNIQKWSFEMNLYYYYNWNYPIISKIKIDIQYE